MNEQQDCENLGAALGDIPAVPPGCQCQWCACAAVSKARDTAPIDYDLPNLDESAK